MQDKTLRREIIERNLEKLQMFKRSTVAKNYIRLLKGKDDVGLFGVTEGYPNDKVRKYLEDFDAIKRFPRE